MTVQTVKLAGKRFVIVPEKDFRNLQRRAKGSTARPTTRRGSHSDAEDRADIELARKRLADPKEKPVPYEQARKELGLP